MSVDLGAVNIFSRDHKRDPFPFYARLRAQTPAARITAPVLGELWLITRYADVVECLKDAERFVKDPRNAGAKYRKTMPPWLPASIRSLEQNMLDTDDPAHRRMRALVNQAFSPRRVDMLSDRIEAIARDLLAGMERNAAPDLLRDFALPLPLTVICELLGVPKADRRKFHKWSTKIMGATSDLKMLLKLPSLFAIVGYLRRMCRARRERPRDDLVTALVEAGEDGDRLSEHELIAMILLLMIAGHETTVNLIASGTLALLEHPEQKLRLLENPALLGSAINELLRFTAPVEIATERYAVQDTEIGGVPIRRGDLVLAVIASANRDERVFTAPDRLDLSRDPNPHVAFGDGIHYCLGHQLARLEAETAFTCLFERFPNLQLAKPAEELLWRETPIVRGLAALPVTY
ncbi:MAG: cytochrome P450 family protein [Hyphomicrobiales bacterium]